MAGDDLVAHRTLRRRSADLLGAPDYVVDAVLEDTPDPVTLDQALGEVSEYMVGTVNSDGVLSSDAMAKTDTYVLAAGGAVQRIADNDSASTHTFVVTNMDAVDTCELLGEGEILGEGTPWNAQQQGFFDLGPGERLYAASQNACEVRVLNFRSGH